MLGSVASRSGAVAKAMTLTSNGLLPQMPKGNVSLKAKTDLCQGSQGPGSEPRCLGSCEGPGRCLEVLSCFRLQEGRRAFLLPPQ